MVDAINLQSLISNLPVLLLLIIPILYVATLAQTPVLGDPTEYTVVANVLGIAHPPGYAFITLVGRLFQWLIPFGSIPWRMHLLSAVSATAACLFVFGAATTYARKSRQLFAKLPAIHVVVGLFAALTVGTAVNVWQHAIHANPHIITAAFLTANLFFLTRWWASGADKWLYIFCISAGLGITHHPLTVFGFPAYAIFILLIRPSILKEWRTLLKMGGLALLGLSLWLYYPLRSPSTPIGPTGMNTLNGFLDHALARGLSDSLSYYSLADQPARALVFWTVLRLQYTLPVMALAVLGMASPLLKRTGLFRPRCASIVTLSPTMRQHRHHVTPSFFHPLVLYTLAFLSHYTFVISLKQQDIMAYLLGPFMVVGLLAGIGLLWVIGLVRSWAQGQNWRERTAVLSIVALAFLAGPLWQFWLNWPAISLRDYSEGSDYVNMVFDRFAGSRQNATLLNDWEHITPLWYAGFVEGRWPDSVDVEPQLISAAGANPWLEGVFTHLPGGPVYLSNYRPQILAGTEFRLRPRGAFYQVVEPHNDNLPPELEPVESIGGAIEIVGYRLPQRQVTAGDYVPFILAMRAPDGTEDFYTPVLRVGDMVLEFTTDSHLTTPNWYADEIIVERFDFALPHDLPNGRFPLELDLKNLSRDDMVDVDLALGELQVAAQDEPIATEHLLANFRQRVGLVGAWAWENGRFSQPITAPWLDPITVQPGDTINLILKWQSLAKAEESYTVFVHLITPDNQPVVSLDYTPLGGATPTHLWIPKWLPGQQMLDPYRLQIPPDLAPGSYFIEVGLYEMVGQRRLYISDAAGNLVGDRYILGRVAVGEQQD